MIKLPQKNIETNRFILTPYQVKLYKEIFALIQKNKTRLVHSFPNMLKATETEMAAKDYAQQKIFDWNKNKAFAFMVFLKAENTLIGHFNLKDIDWKKNECELAYFIDEAYIRQGYATEVLSVLLQVSFKIIQFERVTARIVSTNIASQKLVEKMGLKYEGAFYNDYKTYDNLMVDTHRFGISKEDYFKLNTR